MPERLVDGVAKLFVPDTDGTLPEGITESGLYYYYNNKWNKIGVNL